MQINSITLPEDLIWVDEFDWLMPAEKKEYSLSGALLIDTGLKQAGRTITLQGDADSAWITRGTIKSLQTLANTNATMTLTLNDTRTFKVRFNYENKPIEVKPIIDYSTNDDDDKYQIVLRFYEVE